MPLGYILLVVVALLVVFGVAQRVLDRLRLTDRQALLFVAAIFIGSLIPDIPLGGGWSVNIGGALVPLGLCVFLLFKAGTAWEKWRTILASLLAGAGVFALGRFLPAEPENMLLDPNYLYGLAAGLIAYLFGRSRRGAFVAGILGVLLADAAQAILNAINGTPTGVALGGGGVLDATVLSGLLAVLLAEGIGEVRERMQGGSENRGKTTFDGGEFVDVHAERVKKPHDK
ncbi:MAG: DUF1614 domain-containing protein [Eubacteriales bacterium]|nr:DUF1614 domain-containing protein [Eubacteriales bacterium]